MADCIATSVGCGAWRLALTGLVLVAAGCGTQRPVDPVARATTPHLDRAWWTGFRADRHAKKLAERDALVAAGEPIDLVLVGDSIAQYFEITGSDEWRRRFGSFHTFNLGFAGDTTERLLWRLGAAPGGASDHVLRGLSPRLAVLMIGTNNTGLRNDPPEATAAGIERVVDRLLELVAPEGRVLVLAVFPRGERPDDPLRLVNERVNELIAPLSGLERVELVDLSDALLEDGGVLSNEVAPDSVHLSEAGYRRWAEALAPHVERLLTERVGPPGAATEVEP